MEAKELETKLTGIATELEKFIKKHDEEVKANGTASEETKKTVSKLADDFNATSARILLIEQKLDGNKFGSNAAAETKSIGQTFVESEGYKLLAKGAPRTGKVEVGSFHKTALINATGLNQPLVPPLIKPGIISPGVQRLTVRDLLPVTPISSNLVEYVKEASFTNNAAPQYSAGQYENVVKAESAMTFTLSSMGVSTLAHWIPVSRQLLDDAPAIQGYINSRLTYGLKLVEETELLTGSGIQGHLSGLVTNATTFDTTPVVTASDSYIDVLRRAVTQVQLSFFEPDGIVLHPRDWEVIELTKETGTGISSGMYIYANPRVQSGPQLWGLPVVVTTSMTQGQFLVGNFSQSSMIWDRNAATVEISREHSDYFVRNMAAILVEERLALTVFRATALIYGGFPFGS
jgi:HK97 family phage major capsid protein